MPGVFNPFVEPKPDPPPFESLLADPEPDRTVRTVRLDGDTHILVFVHCTFENIKPRLEALISAIQKHSKEMKRDLKDRGVSLDTSPDPAAASLKLRDGVHLNVYGVTAPGEAKVFQRLAQAIYGLPVRSILTGQHVKVIVRG